MASLNAIAPGTNDRRSLIWGATGGPFRADPLVVNGRRGLRAEQFPTGRYVAVGPAMPPPLEAAAVDLA